MGGRPSRAQESALLAVLDDVIGPDEWRAILLKTKQDALGKNGRERELARRFLAEYSCGKPPPAAAAASSSDVSSLTQYDELIVDNIHRYAELEEMSDEDLRSVMMRGVRAQPQESPKPDPDAEDNTVYLRPPPPPSRRR